MRTSDTSERAQQVAQLGDVGPGDLGGERTGAGDRPVTISTSGMPARL